MTRNELVKVLKVVSDKTRLDILSSIYLKPGISGKELLVSHHVSQPTLSFHLARLQEAKIILVKKIGQTYYYEINWKVIHDFQSLFHSWLNPKKKS